MVNKLTFPAKDNAVQEKINELVDEKQDLLTAGNGIDIAGNIISTNNIFWVEYQTTSYSDIMAAWNAGKIIMMLYSPSGTDSILFLCERLYWSRFYFNTVTNNKQIYNVTLDWNNNWYLSATLLQAQIPAGTSGEVVTYSGTAGTFGALGYTPYDSSNPSGYTSNVGTVTSVNNTSPDVDGNVNLSIPTVNNATLTITQGGTSKGTFTANASSDVTIDLDAGSGSGVEIGDMGFAPLGIDETLNLRRYLNGQVISQSLSPAFTAKVKSAIALHPTLGTTEANWQSEKTLSKLGQCGKFVVDDTEGTIRLPAVVNVQGLLSLSAVGTIKEESLPNITGSFGTAVPRTLTSDTSSDTPDGCFTYSNWASINVSTGTSKPTIAGFNASLANSSYQDDAPVQQEAIQYPYYIQVATGVEETLPAIREYKVNNSDYFGKSMYSDIAPDNASWLASNGQYNERTVYPDYYDWLNSKIGQVITTNGGKVVLSTDTITDYDFIVNQNDQTFRLPLRNGEEDLPASYTEAITVKALVSSSTISATISQNGFAYVSGPASASAYAVLRREDSSNTGTSIGNTATTYAASSGIKTSLFVKKGDTVYVYATQSMSGNLYFLPAIGNGTLYYYVGDTVQDASLINAGAILNTLSGKIGYDDLTTVHCVVETYQSGNSWYRVYDDGWVEQGGKLISSVSGSGFLAVYFLKPFQQDPTILLTQQGSYFANYYSGQHCNNAQTLTTTYFTTYVDGNIPVQNWFACGYGA